MSNNKSDDLKWGYLIEGRGRCRGHYKCYANNRVTVKAISVSQHHYSSDGQNGSNNLVKEQTKGHRHHNVLHQTAKRWSVDYNMY